VHCRTEQEAEALKAELRARLAECHLELHPTKTKMVYCRDGKRKSTYPNVKFDFLGYCFRPRWIKKSRDNSMFCGFNPAVSPSALKAMRSTIRDLNIRRQTQLSLADIARTLNPLVRGWIEYYGRYAPSALSPMLRYVNQTLVRWAMRKFKRFRAHKRRASRFTQKLVREKMSLFVHWRIGMTGTFAGWEPCELRGSCTDLREAGGEIPSAYSPVRANVFGEDRSSPYRLPAVKEEHSARGREDPRADRPIGHMARDHDVGGQSEPHAARMGELLFGRRLQQGVSGARRLRGGAVAPVVALQAQSQATRGRELSTLALVHN